MAAKAAVEAEFPEAYALALKPQVNKGQKRKGEEAKMEGKNLLCNMVSKILSRPVTKDDIVYETTEEGDPKKFKSKVSVPAHNKIKHQGEVADSKKDAEQNAAAKCIAQLEKTCKKVLEEHANKKAKANQEALEKLKTAAKEKKEAKKAAAA